MRGGTTVILMIPGTPRESKGTGSGPGIHVSFRSHPDEQRLAQALSLLHESVFPRLGAKGPRSDRVFRLPETETSAFRQKPRGRQGKGERGGGGEGSRQHDRPCQNRWVDAESGMDASVEILECHETGGWAVVGIRATGSMAPHRHDRPKPPGKRRGGPGDGAGSGIGAIAASAGPRGKCSLSRPFGGEAGPSIPGLSARFRIRGGGGRRPPWPGDAGGRGGFPRGRPV